VSIFAYFLLLLLRFVLLVFLFVFVVFYFIRSTPLKDDLDFTNDTFGLLLAVYAAPSSVMPLIGGLVSSRYGLQAGVIMFAVIVYAGLVLSSFSPLYKSLDFLIFGRFLFGVGAESLYTCAEALLVERFTGYELTFAYGSIISAAQAGSFFAYYFCPMIADRWGYEMCFYLAAFLGTIALILTFSFTVVDHWFCLDDKNDYQPIPSLAISDEKSEVRSARPSSRKGVSADEDDLTISPDSGSGKAGGVIGVFVFLSLNNNNKHKKQNLKIRN